MKEQKVMSSFASCPRCGASVVTYKNPVPTVDIVIVFENRGVVLIQRRNPPHGWALPGGFVDYGESVEQAAVREAKEETGLDVSLVSLLGVYSDPARDSRLHTLSTVFVASPKDPNAQPRGADDAILARIFPFSSLPSPLAFDHEKILADFAVFRQTGGAKRMQGETGG